MKPQVANALKTSPVHRCAECGRAFRSAKAAIKAMSEGCPKCGGACIDEVVS